MTAEKLQAVPEQPASLRPVFVAWLRQHSVARRFAFGLAIAAFISGIVTVIVMTGTEPGDGDDTDLVFGLLILDAILAASLAIFVGHRLTKIWLERRRGRAGAGLYLRMGATFSVVAAVPAMVMAVVSLVFLDQGLEAWFSKKVSTALGRSEVVASAYLQEHRNNFRADALELANQINLNAASLALNRDRFSEALTALSERYGMAEAYVIDSSGAVIARSDLSFQLQLDRGTLSESFEQAREGGIIVLSAGVNDRVRVMVRLNRFNDAFLIVGRFVDSRVLAHLSAIRDAVSSYQSLEDKRQGFQVTFGLIFVVTAVMLVLAAIWLGLNYAHQMAGPISNLIAAAERVRKGDLTARVARNQSRDELSRLSLSFNRMTSELESQKQGLLAANMELDERRRFTETVLSGVSAGVVGLDENGRITLPNRSASTLLGVDLNDHLREPLEHVIPEMRDLVHRVIEKPKRLQRAEVRIVRDELVRTLDVRVVAEHMGEEIRGFVVTFDDVTDLMTAQRKAAWSDVARRIAHEIKNPLTPIQLAAERLKRKYREEVKTDPETFETCTETIVRQVEDIGRLVDEFSAFARMPEPDIGTENLSDICEQAVFLEQNRNSGLTLDAVLPEKEIWMACDKRQISRAVANILKNAAEAVSEDLADQGLDIDQGLVSLRLSQDMAGIHIIVDDNGPGLPKADREKLTEPYVTSRVKGTGLGLAIVKKIAEDHKGHLELTDSEHGGASIRLSFGPEMAAVAPDMVKAKEAGGDVSGSIDAIMELK